MLPKPEASELRAALQALAETEFDGRCVEGALAACAESRFVCTLVDLDIPHITMNAMQVSDGVFLIFRYGVIVDVEYRG